METTDRHARDVSSLQKLPVADEKRQEAEGDEMKTITEHLDELDKHERELKEPFGPTKRIDALEALVLSLVDAYRDSFAPSLSLVRKQAEKIAVFIFVLLLAVPLYAAPTYEQIDATISALDYSHWLVGDSGLAWQEIYDNVGPASTPAQEIDYYLRTHWGEEVAVSKPGFGYDPDPLTVAQAIYAGDGIVYLSITGHYSPWTQDYVPDLSHWVSFDSVEPNNSRPPSVPEPATLFLLAAGIMGAAIKKRFA